MGRVFTWKALGIAVGLVLIAAFICIVSGNTGMGSALIVVAAVEGVLHAALIGLASAKRGRHESRTA